MSSEKRILLAVLLSALIFLVYFKFVFTPPPPTSTDSNKAKESVSQPIVAVPESKVSNSPIQEAVLSPEQRTPLNFPLYKVESSTWNGILNYFELKLFKQNLQKDSSLVNLFQGTPEKNLLLLFKDTNFSLPEKLPFQLKSQGESFVEYEWANNEIRLTKKLEWDSQNYSGTVHVLFENLGQKPLEAALGLHLQAEQHPRNKGTFSFLKGPENLKTPLYYNEKGVTRIHKLEPSQSQTDVGSFAWAGIEDRYFLMSLVSRAISPQSSITYGQNAEANQIYIDYFYPKDIVPPASQIKKEFSVYLGPKQLDYLKLMNVHLDQAVDYGWFSAVAYPILFLLKLFHSWVGNWGVAIILLTVFIKLILHPINKKSLQSMKAMQQLQPRLVELREKYKQDRERLNMEMMNLFKTHKVNPMGGCLPMLLQMPVYIALYKVLYNAIELYQAPFFWFYKDLSAPDPYFISPILLGFFMVLQQKMTPNPNQDPDQARIMMLMPVIFSVFMLFVPSGLVLYIFVNTVMTVIQQYLHQHDLSLADLIKRRKAT